MTRPAALLPRPVHFRWLATTSAASLACLLAVPVLPEAALALALGSLGAYLFLAHALAPRIGPADVVSGLRVLLAVLALSLAEPGALQFIVFAAAAVSDAVDGLIARRLGSTGHGEILDMEADQILVLCLALAGLQAGPHALWGLALPAMKYVFVLLEAILGLEAGAAKPVGGDNRRAKAIYATVLLALFAGVLPASAPALHSVLLGAAIPLLAASFTADLLYKWRAQRNRTLG